MNQETKDKMWELLCKKHLIPKADLKDSQHYAGNCRNAQIAVWSDKHQAFFHWRHKWGSRFIEKIYHPDDEQVYDVFRVVMEYEPEFDEIVEIPQHDI